MNHTAPNSLHLPKPIMGYFPITFIERGLALPFTTPALAGTRVRPGERVPLELLIPNPPGGRGIYILPSTDLQGLCRPSLHDLRLVMLIAERAAITPSAIRLAALDVAGEGLAGREAIAAAERARAAEERAALETNFEMLLALLRQVDPAQTRPGQGTAADLERRARAVVARIAPELGLPPAEVARLLETLAAAYVPAGVGRSKPAARIPILHANLLDLRKQAQEWWRNHPDDGGLEAGLLAMVADLTLRCLDVALSEVQGLTQDMRGLLRVWHAEQAETAQRIARVDWLIDGWDRITEAWRASAALPSRRDALWEITQMLPVMPKEATDWFNIGLEMQEDLMRHRRRIVLNEDWRTGVTVFDEIARNEQVLASTTALVADAAAAR